MIFQVSSGAGGSPGLNCRFVTKSNENDGDFVSGIVSSYMAISVVPDAWTMLGTGPVFGPS
jgi:hypothetical protein